MKIYLTILLLCNTLFLQGCFFTIKSEELILDAGSGHSSQQTEEKTTK